MNSSTPDRSQSMSTSIPDGNQALSSLRLQGNQSNSSIPDRIQAVSSSIPDRGQALSSTMSDRRQAMLERRMTGQGQSSMLEDTQPMITSSHDSLINFAPPPLPSSSTMEYGGYDYPQYGTGSGFYTPTSSTSYSDITPASASYSDNYPYDMYSSNSSTLPSSVNPFSAAAAGSSFPSYQSQTSAFHPPPPSYPPQYPSDFYPPPP